jgi:hypothetical protein
VLVEVRIEKMRVLLLQEMMLVMGVVLKDWVVHDMPVGSVLQLVLVRAQSVGRRQGWRALTHTCREAAMLLGEGRL